MVSKRQREIYDFVVAYASKHGYPPTVREIGAEVGLASPSTVHVHLAKLEQAGYLRRDPTKPRALELVGRERAQSANAPGNVHVLPLVGEIAAGSPLLAEENVEDYIGVPEPLARGGGEEFLLRVKGESMVEAGIMPATRHRAKAVDCPQRRRRRGARRGGRGGRRGDREDVLPRRRARSTPAGELEHGASVSRPRADPGPGDRPLPLDEMTLALLTRTLDEELAAIARGDVVECLVCGELIDPQEDRAECHACGSVLERRREPGPDQLALL